MFILEFKENKAAADSKKSTCESDLVIRDLERLRGGGVGDLDEGV